MEKLDIIVGDDAFKDFFTENIFKNQYIKRLREELPDYTINVALETEPKEVIKKAMQYDVVVTDLDYTGESKGKEGYDVIDEVCNLMPKPLLILCTSSDNYEEIKSRTQGKIDYYAGSQKGHKFVDLVDILIEHYKK